MKLLADMGVSLSTVEFLKNTGYDVLHVRDLKMQKATDSEIVDVAIKEDRFIITFDLDFGTILAASKSNIPSTLIFRLSDCRPENINKILLKILPLIKIDLLSGCIVLVEHDRFRVRKLPIT